MFQIFHPSKFWLFDLKNPKIQIHIFLPCALSSTQIELKKSPKRSKIDPHFDHETGCTHTFGGCCSWWFVWVALLRSTSSNHLKMHWVLLTQDRRKSSKVHQKCWNLRQSWATVDKTNVTFKSICCLQILCDFFILLFDGKLPNIWPCPIFWHFFLGWGCFERAFQVYCSATRRPQTRRLVWNLLLNCSHLKLQKKHLITKQEWETSDYVPLLGVSATQENRQKICKQICLHFLSCHTFFFSLWSREPIAKINPQEAWPILFRCWFQTPSATYFQRVKQIPKLSRALKVNPQVQNIFFVCEIFQKLNSAPAEGSHLDRGEAKCCCCFLGSK